MVTNFAGIIIWTNNFPTLVSFYKKILYKIPYSEKTNFISFKKDSFRLGIGTHSKVHNSNQDPYRIMINLKVSNIYEEAQRFKEMGIIFIRTVEKEHWGGLICTFNDPDNNIIQLLQFPEI